MASSRKAQGDRLAQAEPIVGIRIALTPVVLKNGKAELMGEIAAKVFDLPPDWNYVQLIETRIKGLTVRAEPDVRYGPDFDMVPR